MRLVPATQEELDIVRGRDTRGRTSYPILKQFLETNRPVMRIDLTGSGKNPITLHGVLSGYVKNHNMPIRLSKIKGEIYLIRTDMDAEGNIIPEADRPKADPTEITDDFVRSQ